MFLTGQIESSTPLAIYSDLLYVFVREQMDTFVNPLRSSMRNMSNAVKSLPDSLAEGMTKVSDNMGRMSERLGQDLKQSILKAGTLLCVAFIRL